VIEELRIRGLGVIEDVTLRLAPGLTVVTGETGAGKTMLVTAIGLLLGDRAASGLVRDGVGTGLVEAMIDPAPPEAAAWLGEDPEDGLTVARELPEDGRSRARIAGRLAPVSALAEVLGGHVEVHAQHEHVRLARPEVQRALLDRFAGEPHAHVLAAHRETHRAWRELELRRRALAGDAQERARELARLVAELAEIAEVAPDVERDADVEARIDRLANAEELAATAGGVAAALGAEAAGEAVGGALALLRRLPVEDPALVELRVRVEGLAAELADVARTAADFARTVDADAAELDRLQARKRALTALMRKFGASLEDVLAYADSAQRDVAALEALESDGGGLEADVAAALLRVRELEVEVTRGRQLAAERLSEVVGEHLADLAMPHARFIVEIVPRDDDEPSADGADRIRFLLAANPGEPPVAIATAASGGERSRVALAIEVALADVDDAAVLVFDEVDAGIGGSTALAVGEKLARLAHASQRPRQVLCVTHLAQLAAFADVHHVVEKGLAGGRTVTTARRVADEDRVAEISRMLGGELTAAAGLAHARELLDAAAARRAS
jgi:DNA repair protein RecN (Recombination protein N)